MDRVKDNSKDKAKMSVEARSRFEVAMKKQTKVRPKIAAKKRDQLHHLLQVMIDNIMGNGLDVPLSGLREASK